MFNLYFRPYVPGFRVGQQREPGFNVDEHVTPWREGAWFEKMLPAPTTPYPFAQPTEPTATANVPLFNPYYPSLASPYANMRAENTQPTDPSLGSIFPVADSREAAGRSVMRAVFL